jgi:prepilin-type N-terminal cleavage/methylation domain-containing protein
MQPRRNKSAGFTLMEVVVATSLMAVIMSVLFMGLRLGANAWRRGEQKLADRARSVAGMAMLERQVSSAVPRVLTEQRDRVTVKYVDFRGSVKEARFVTAASWQSDRSRPLYMATYRVVRLKEGGEQLMISETGLTDAASMSAALFRDDRFRFGNEQPSRTQEIGEPAERIEISYLQPVIDQKPAQWVTDWTPELHIELPRGVRLQWLRDGHVETATLVIPQYREPQAR